jgi:hypothetical protein
MRSDDPVGGSRIPVQPVAIADFDPEVVVSWKLFQEWNQPVGELMPIWKDAAAEKRELENDWAEFFAQNIHRFQELLQFQHRSPPELCHA